MYSGLKFSIVFLLQGTRIILKRIKCLTMLLFNRAQCMVYSKNIYLFSEWVQNIWGRGFCCKKELCLGSNALFKELHKCICEKTGYIVRHQWSHRQPKPGERLDGYDWWVSMPRRNSIEMYVITYVEMIDIWAILFYLFCHKLEWDL